MSTTEWLLAGCAKAAGNPGKHTISCKNLQEKSGITKVKLDKACITEELYDSQEKYYVNARGR